MKGTSIEGSDKIRRTIMELQGVERDTERQFEVKQSKSKPVEKEYSSVLSRVSSCKFRVLQSATGERTCFNDQALDNTKSGAKEIECPKILSETEKFDRALTKFEKTFTRNLICNFKFVACDVRSKSPDRQKVSKKGKKRRKSKNINEVVGYMAAFCNSFERTSNQRNVDEDRDEVDSVISNETDFGFDYLLDQSVNMNAISKIMPNDCDSTTDVSFLFEKETKSENTSRCRNASKTDQIFVPLSDENSPQLVVDNKEVLKSYSFEGISWENSASNINSSLKANDHRSDTIFNALTEIFTPIFYLTKNVSAKVIDSVVQSVSKNEILSIVKPETSTPLSFINNLISPLVSLKVKKTQIR